MYFFKYTDAFLVDSKQGRATEYRFKLRIFHEYLTETYDTTDNNYFKIIDSLTSRDILNSVEYYINRKGRKKISFCSPVRVYFWAVIEFLKFLNSNNYPVCNDLYDSQQKQNDLREDFESKLRELRLKESESDVHISTEECETLIQKCNFCIDTVPDNELIEGDVYNSTYTKFLSAIIMKFVLFSGASKETINKMALIDYNYDLNRVTINGYDVHLPDGLAVQFKKYIRIRASICAECDKDKLFVKREIKKAKRTSKSSQLESSIMCDVLKDVTGSSSVRSVSKYAIIEMIKKGVPQYLIMDFTGYKDEVYNYCLDIANEESSEADTRFLDSKMRSFEIFEKL